jgi:hypothetical protein
MAAAKRDTVTWVTAAIVSLRVAGDRRVRADFTDAARLELVDPMKTNSELGIALIGGCRK